MVHSVEIAVTVVNPDSMYSKAKTARSSTDDNGRFQTSHERTQFTTGRSIPRRRG